MERRGPSTHRKDLPKSSVLALPICFKSHEQVLAEAATGVTRAAGGR